ncbi:MAG TPA: alpha-isopropylmalate synthase regulatory domain-containing protein [Bryobacteraceae bacterium]|jgi:2-isopropylmalate synthase|nr:alpha-isopropylmalate synthase regulatory domain-containing protein [Bryobacteraceae bacterium]
MRVFALDNTFGHNPGRAGLSFSLADRLAIVQELDHLGIDYAEMGCPGASASVRKFFGYVRTEFLRPAHIRLAASVRLAAVRDGVARDEEIQAALESGAPAAIVEASCWQVGEGCYEEYCRRIGDVVRFLKAHGLEVIFRDEDFFQCHCREPLFAWHTLEAAKTAGADALCLRDSTGSGLPELVRETCAEVRKRFVGILGICAHDDCDLALANTLGAVGEGFTHVEGSINAYGERRGLANLCSTISNLERKLGHSVIGAERLGEMTRVARLVADAGREALGRRGPAGLAQAPVAEGSPLDGVDPHLVTELTDAARRDILGRIEFLQADGYEMRAADGTLELLVREAVRPELRPFVAERYELTSHAALYAAPVSTATATMRVGDVLRSETEDGDGAVNALERSLRQCLFALYPEIVNLKVSDYRVQILDYSQGTTVRVRVSVEWAESGHHWVTQGVSSDLIEATWLALVDGFRLSLMRRIESSHTLPVGGDFSWAV